MNLQKRHAQLRSLASVFLTVVVLTSAAYRASAQHSPTPQYNGKIEKTIKPSEPGKFQFNPVAPAGSPNVIWILLDDVGFGAISGFGGLVETPTFDSLATNGLRYTNFHTTAICSPTRAALLTGRNHHSVNVPTVGGATFFPGHTHYMPFEKATAAEIFRENGYSTFASGKWHLTPVADQTAAGPFNRWPTGRGFDQFYGFMEGETDQYTPQLIENTLPVKAEPEGKHLTTLLIDKSISYIANQKSAAPEKPFFLYLTPGATHAPHQVDKVWIDKYKGKFDQGWDKYREQVLARQKKLKIVPQDVVLPPRNPGIKAWESLSADEKKIFSRFMEAYAGFLSHTDYEVGRLINYLKDIKQLDNTLIVLMVGDNGASKEGGFTGQINGLEEYITGRLFEEDYNTRISNIVKLYDEIGTGSTSINYPQGWAMAANTPFRYLKQDASSEGGTRNPLILFYPKGIKDKGAIRTQYSHVNSILPTTLDLLQLKVPSVINGYKQDTIEGTSLAYTIDNPEAADRHVLQYYEISGTRAVYKEGWKAEVHHERGKPFSEDKWELYDLNSDFNERNDLAAKNPSKLKELQEAFDKEAYKYNVYPLAGDTTPRTVHAVPNRFGGKSKVVLYPGLLHLNSSAGPSLSGRSFSITADADIPSGNVEGALFALGGRFGGFSFFVKDGKLQAAHNVNTEITRIVADGKLPEGKVLLRYELNLKQAAKLTDNAGTEALYINDKKVAERQVSKIETLIFSYDEGLDVGRDDVSPVVKDYKIPFRFTGVLRNIQIDYK
jgi:arylsulfatase A-like enzyme